ncbi:hypothetical protein NEDG_00744 [Nematocida displodere]|uniref:Uncharacterized protein n=1 Tax=Nematocida displodere TaxID=1805483 RepID=A0A177EDM4_9MICR|nr:hypothetical protein NEDG_00744 [Nematocida displodere]
MEKAVSESALEAEVRKEVSLGDFKDAHANKLKRRFAEYYENQKRKWEDLKGFTIAHNPIERFKDIPAIFSISLHPDFVVVGPIEKEGVRHQYTDVIGNLLGHINQNLVHPYLLDLLDRGDYPFYDNHIVVEVVDLRDTEAVVHRVLLKGTFAGMPYTPSLMLSTKTEDFEESSILAKTHAVCLDPGEDVFEVLKVQDYNLKKLDLIRIDPPQKKKAQISAVIKEYNRIRSNDQKEVYPGLERLGANRVYRTIRFVGGSLHYSINAIANTDHIEAVFRQGEIINTAIGGFITRRKFTSTTQIDLYIDSTKRLLEIYHADLKCICDISATPRKPAPVYQSPPTSSEKPKRPIIQTIAPGTLTRTNPRQTLSQDKHLRYRHVDSPRKDDPQDHARSERRNEWLESPGPHSPRASEIDDFDFDYVNKKFI